MVQVPCERVRVARDVRDHVRIQACEKLARERTRSTTRWVDDRRVEPLAAVEENSKRTRHVGDFGSDVESLRRGRGSCGSDRRSERLDHANAGSGGCEVEGDGSDPP